MTDSTTGELLLKVAQIWTNQRNPRIAHRGGPARHADATPTLRQIEIAPFVEPTMVSDGGRRFRERLRIATFGRSWLHCSLC